MNINVNGQPCEIASAILSEVLVALGYADAKIATAVNEQFVPATQRHTYELSAGDRVEILAPMQGG